MASIELLIYLGLVIFGANGDCFRGRINFKQEIICYTSSYDIEKLENLICKCTIVIYNGGDLQNLNYSNIERVQALSKKINPTIEFVIGISDDQQVSDNLAIGFLKKTLKKISSLFGMTDGVELNMRGHEKSHLTKFIKELRDVEIESKFSKRKRLLLALPSNLEILVKEFDIRNLSKYIDLFVISTHYLADSDEIYKTFHPSRLIGLYDVLNTDSLVDLVYSLGGDEKKMIISLPANAYKFQLNNQYDNAPRAPSLDKKPSLINRKEFCNTMTNNGEWTIERDEDFTAPYTFNKSVWIAFEDSISTRIKGKYVILRNLGGIAVRNIDDDGSTNCGKAITEHVYNSFSHNIRMSREAIFDSLKNDTIYLNNKQNRHLKNTKVSNFRISRIVDSHGKIHAVRENTQIEFTCIRQGYFVHPKNCNRFYRCVKFNQAIEDYSVFEFDCPSGLTFDETTEVCVWPGALSQGLPCPGSIEIAPTLPFRFRCLEEGYYADPQNCRWFFACINMGRGELTAYEFRCPYGLVFDEKTLICQWPWLVPECSSVNEAKSPYSNESSTISSNDELRKMDKIDGYQSHDINEKKSNISPFRKEYMNLFQPNNTYKNISDVNQTLMSTSLRYKDSYPIGSVYDPDQNRLRPTDRILDNTFTKYPNNNSISSIISKPIELEKGSTIFTEASNKSGSSIKSSIDESNGITTKSGTGLFMSTNSLRQIGITPMSLFNSTQNYYDQRIKPITKDSAAKVNIDDNGEKTMFVHNFDSSAKQVTLNSAQPVENIKTYSMEGHKNPQNITPVSAPRLEFGVEPELLVMNNNNPDITRDITFTSGNNKSKSSIESDGITKKSRIDVFTSSNFPSQISLTTPMSSFNAIEKYHYDVTTTDSIIRNSIIKSNITGNGDETLFAPDLHSSTGQVTFNAPQLVDSNGNDKSPPMGDSIQSITPVSSSEVFGRYNKTDKNVDSRKGILSVSPESIGREGDISFTGDHNNSNFPIVHPNGMVSNSPSGWRVAVTPVSLFNLTDKYYEGRNKVMTSNNSILKMNIKENEEKTMFVHSLDSSTSSGQDTLNSTQSIGDRQVELTNKIFNNNENLKTSPMTYNSKSTTSVYSSIVLRMYNETHKHVDPGKGISPNFVKDIESEKKTIQHHEIDKTQVDSYRSNPFLNGALDNRRLSIGNTKNPPSAYNDNPSISNDDEKELKTNNIVKFSYTRNPFLREVLDSKNITSDNKKIIHSWKEGEQTTMKFYHTHDEEPITVSNKNIMNGLESTIESRNNKGNVIVKYNDLHPILLKKLRAECKCKADPFGGFKYSKEPLFIDSSMGIIDLRNYDEANVYVDLGLPEKSSQITKKRIGNNNFEASTTNLPIANNEMISRQHDNNEAREARSFPNSRQHHYSTTMIDNIDSSPWNRIECARPGLFRDTNFCNKFYACYWDKWENKFILRVFNCPVHLAFDNEIGGCNWPSNGPACQNNQLLL